MVNTIKQSISVREVRRKLELIVVVIFLTRIMAMIPVPGVDSSLFKQWVSSTSNDALNLFSSFTGGSFESFSMFALGVTPLITAQIIVQLMTSVIKPLEELHKKGTYGQKVIKRISNIVAIILAAIQSCCMAIGFSKSGYISTEMNEIVSVILITVFMTIGTGITIWISHIVTEKTFCNGVSILLMANIMSRLPEQLYSMMSEITESKSFALKAVCTAVTVVAIIAIIIVVIYMSEGYHPLKVQYSQKMSQFENVSDTGIIPIKVGISGVMPVIFASSLMAIPQLVATIAGKGYGSGFSKIFLNMMSQKNWFDNENPIYSFGLLIYLALIIFFSFFYLPLTFNAAEVADNVRQLGAFVPGVRAGEDTEYHITKISRRLTAIGVVMLICVTVIPIIILGSLGISNSVSGTSIIIVVGVSIELVQQLRLEAAGRNYCGILEG